MHMGPSKRDLCVFWIAKTRFYDINCKASEGVVATPRSRGGNMGTRGHDAYQISLPI